MPKFKIMIEDLSCYSCLVEAEDMDEAEEIFEEALEQHDHNYYDTCGNFANMRDEDGSIEAEWYEENE